ncbi:hypothetical protein AB0M02_44385 [Actinoplanes sp. NPDC051861]|uniref:hypothetical protein n=1 Tax=Actinoplanes sp. NPDC051861 TaxID=3155170 RepID=UPI00341B3018
MIEQADRFALTTGPDGRVLLTLTLRRHPRASPDGFARAQRYWACAPGGARPRWLTGGHTDDDVREAENAHAAAAAYVPGVTCTGCGDRQWKPVNRGAVTQYVLTGVTAGCLTCGPRTAPVSPPPLPVPLPALVPVQEVEAQSLPAVTVRIDGAAAALLWSATGGDARTMSSLVTDLVTRNFGLRPAHT